MAINESDSTEYKQFESMMKGYNFNNLLIALDVSSNNKGESNHNSKQTRTAMNMPAFILILSGEIELSVDYKFHTLKKNYWVVLGPTSYVNLKRISADFSAKIILASETFIVDTLLDKKPIPVSHFMDMRNNPYIIMSDEDTNAIKFSMDRIFYYIEQTNHSFIKDMLHNTFYNLVLEASDIYIRYNKNRKHIQKITHKEEIVVKFMELLEKYVRDEHNPSFYAKKIFISTQYLSVILKHITGNTANYWIAKRVIREAKTLLRTPGTTIQEITDILHFADQSSFGKFFKKHTGISPKKYRDAYSAPQ
jgi:AraC-type DNA-binding domain-containing proteins